MNNRIVILDYEPEMLELLKMDLETEGYKVFTTSDIQEARQLIDEIQPNLVLMDVICSGEGDYALLKHLKEGDATKDIPVIILTSKGFEKEVQRGFELGADDYVAKPFYSVFLLDRIKRRIASKEKKSSKADPKIVVVDDDVELTQLLKNHLQKRGYQTFEAYDGRQGLELIRATNPDLVLLDVIMPEMDGFEVLQKLKEDDSMKNVIVILLTAKGLDQDIQRGFDLGTDDYITKPFPPALLDRRIEEILPSRE